MRQIRFCPRCHSTNVRPSHKKNFLERAVLRFVRLRPYRCEECDARFLRITDLSIRLFELVVGLGLDLARWI